jgi:MSHA biogenesis protein MshM
MYKQHFGLRELPFSITPDTSFFFACAAYQEALNTLLIAARNGEGFIKISGEVGTGKTLLCRKFLASLGSEFVSAYIPNPYLEPRALLLALVDELGVKLEQDVEQHQLMKALTLALLDYARQNKRVLVCLDEAQAMPLETLEALRLLTNLETEKRKLLQVVLFGQPELDARLDQPSVRQLKQRITFQYHLGVLTPDDTDFYVGHRLTVAGYSGGRLFTRGAVRKLYKASGGVPRLINIIAHKSLMAAFGEGAAQVEKRHVSTACDDTPAAQQGGWRLFGWMWS